MSLSVKGAYATSLSSAPATATPLHGEVDDGSGFPPIKLPLGQPFLVRNIFADFKRHDLGPNFHERNFDSALTTHFMTAPLWGLGRRPRMAMTAAALLSRK
jgi:hypothetical protein